MSGSSRNVLVLFALIVIIVLVAWWLYINRKQKQNETPDPVTHDKCCSDADCPEGTSCDLETGACCPYVPEPPCPEQCPAGPPGENGMDGIMGYASYVRSIQSPNNSVPPGTAFTVDTEVLNTMPGDVVASAGAGGTVWTLNTVGTYVFDYEMSLGSAGSIALYKGSSSGSLAVDNQTIAGSSSATTWIHGKSPVVVASSPVVVAVSSVVGTANVVVSGNAAGYYIVRVNITRVA